MNKVILTGRLTKDPTIKYNGEMCIARFTVACDRRFKKDGQQSADFPSCVAFGKTGEFAEKYARKGMKFDIVGRLQTGSYEDKDGKTVYTTEVVVEDIEFGESKKSQGETKEEPKEEFMEVEDDTDLPFN
jgi:single-strand DNA-binding protein